MRILTVRQPWAWAIIHGGKDVENRVQNIAGDYRGPVAIHVALADDEAHAMRPTYGVVVDTMESFIVGYERTVGTMPYDEAPWWRHNGQIIGVVDLVNVHFSGECWGFDGDGERWCSRWAEHGAHHLVLANPRSLAEPIPYRGALGLRHLDDEMVTRVEVAIA